jgi:hypothetical protein
MTPQTEHALERLVECLDADSVQDCFDQWKYERRKARELEQAVAKAWFEQQWYLGIDELEVRKDGTKAIVATHRIKPSEVKQFAKIHHLIDESRLVDVAMGVLERYELPGREFRQSHFTGYMLGSEYEKAITV